ncbi:MAG: FAD-dependent monooxygenase [Pseudomonadota bacterium]
MSFDADVLIAGGGTVGLAAAAALSQAGFAVTLIERAAPPPDFNAGEVDLRVYALSPASMRLLDGLGVWQHVTQTRSSPYRGMQVWHGEPSQALRFDALPDQPLGWIVEHGLLNAALWAQAGDWQRLSDTAISEVRVDEEGATVTLGDDRRLTARLLVVADGPDSPLRAQLGIDSIGWDYAQRALVAHVVTERPHGSVARQRFLPSGPLALLPLADGRCSIVWSCDAVLAGELMALDDAAFALRLGTASGQVLGSITACTPRKSFPLRLKHVPAPVVPGAVVIGDAAHVVHPLAGQGVNLGLADAEALAATLKAARDAGRGWWRARTLQAYARQRRADTVEMLAMTDGLSRAFSGDALLGRTLGWGLSLVDRAGPLKQWFAARAQGG